VSGILHQTEEQLELYALGRLPEAGVAAVEEHLLVCASCQEKLDEVEAFALAMREGIAAEPDAGEQTDWFAWLRRPPSAWAIGFAAILLAAGLYLSLSRSRVAPLASLQLTAMRGDIPSVAPARETDITLNLEADAESNGAGASHAAPQISGSDPAPPPVSPAFEMEVVDSTGGTVVKKAPVGGDAVTLGIKKQLAQDTYFVRLYGSGGKLLHEYAFRVQAGL
jgi:hypothetical protein